VLADRAYQIAGTRFEEGVASQLELIDARLALDQAKVNRAQAARDLQVAQIRMALLPDLPLSGVSAQPVGGAVSASLSTGASN
jgi:ABC-type iron transport system FetAB permease component